MYHHVNPKKDDMITVSPQTFEAHLQHRRHSGYKTVTLDELAAFVAGAGQLPDKSVVLSFDDGYLDNYVYAYPLLKQYGLKAVIFLVTGWVDAATAANANTKDITEELKKTAVSHDEGKKLIAQGQFNRVIMNWDMVKEADASGLVDFQSHTVSHKNCDLPVTTELMSELKDSKEALEKNLSKPCRYLCWPKGRFSSGAVEAAKNTGYKALFTTQAGVVKKGDDLLALKRITVKEGAQWFKSRLKVYTSPILSDIYLKIKG
jgi:peptidoglycan/xylan/chitin deacetylase (PgdA/CDA1 family)